MTDTPFKTQFLDDQPDDRAKADARARELALGSTVTFKASGAIDEDTGFQVGEADEVLLGGNLDYYQMRQFLGHGSMGRVYLAWHGRLHRLCAVKVIAPELVRAEPSRLEMFLSEARSAAKLNHPNIVSVHSLGEARGYHFIEMEYVDGVSLWHLTQERTTLPPLLATQLMAQVASALRHAHSHQIIHRDVKPDNVMVAGAKLAKLADFGLARIVTDATGKTVSNLAGTPAFMSPELFQGKPASSASDVYALGASYFALLAGKAPFQAQTLSELRNQHIGEPPPRISQVRADVPPLICDFIREMLAKAPEERPASGDELVARFERIARALVETRELVALAMEGMEITWSLEAGRYCFQAPLPRNRSQKVFAEETNSEVGNDRLLSVWSPCAPATSEHYSYVLELNSRLPFGAISVREFEGQPYFVMFQNHPRATLDPEEIQASIISIAHWADLVEHRLTGGDVH